MAVEWGYALSLLVSALIAGYVAWTSWQRRSSPGNKPLALLMLALVIWSLCYAVWWLRLPGPSPFFWLDATYVGVVMVPIAFLTFALRFTGHERLLSRNRSVLLSLVPVLILILLWTDPSYHLFFGDLSRDQEVGAIFEGGFGFYLNVAYGYSIIFAGMLFIIRSFRRSKGLYRQQMAAIMVAALFPFISNLISLLGLSPFPRLDLTPITFTLTGSVFAFALHRLGLLDVVPIARHTLVEEMSDGVLVLDDQNRIVDINPAAENLLPASVSAPIGRSALTLLDPWPELRARFEGQVAATQQIVLPGKPPRTLDVRISSLRDRGALTGRLVILRDVSEQVRIEKELRRTNQRLQKHIRQVEELQVKLREQAIRDSLTGLFNRRYLEETLIRELAKVQRSNETLSVAMLDVDNFKTFNDRFGHAAGDSMLLALAGLLMQNTRTSDIVCRYGGEEFVVVLPGADTLVAFARIEFIRSLFENRILEFEGKEMSSTVSAGVAGFPENGQTYEDLLDAADQAMYLAKKKGGNQVMPITPA
jgi:diguanylate cyclase (GGDEF)-like protein